MAEFSLQLNDDQKQLQSWVHEFADTVIRPAGVVICSRHSRGFHPTLPALGPA